MSAKSSVVMSAPGDNNKASRSVRVGVVCDFLEEQWPSMDLVGDMLCRNLAQHYSEIFTVTQLRPTLRSRCSRLPFLPSRLARNADRWANRFHDYPRWLGQRRTEYDLFHLVDHSYSQLIHDLPAHKTVVTCHDLDTFRCLLEPDKEPRPAWFRSMTRRVLSGFTQAAHVIVVSEATRQEILRHGLFPADRISVIPNGLHPSCSAEPDVQADRAAKVLLGLDSASGPLLLSVGNTLPRKRLDVLLRVFAAVRNRNGAARLIRVGGLAPEHQKLAAELKIGPEMVCVPFLERDVLAAVYRQAALLLHTAEAEGFGLPVIEAMGCGCPVVASDVPVLREVGGAAATYCPVGKIETWAETVSHLLEEREHQPAVWEQRQGASLRNAARFSWAENAQQTSVVYRKVRERI